MQRHMEGTMRLLPLSGHRNETSKGLDGVYGCYPPEHRLERFYVVRIKERSPGLWDGAGEIAVAGHKEQKRGVDDV